MVKYYTRACNFYYGVLSKKLVKKKSSLPLCGKTDISFDRIEVITRKNKKISSKIISIKSINKLKFTEKKKITKDLKNITKKRKNFIEPTLMGILNMTPDSFSDGGIYNKNEKAFSHIKSMAKSGAI